MGRLAVLVCGRRLLGREGRAAVRGAAIHGKSGAGPRQEEGAPTRHILTADIIHIADVRATARGYVVVVNVATKEITTVGDLDIAFTKLADGWRIQRYEFDPIVDAAPAA